jgi:hypothetical protein
MPVSRSLARFKQLGSYGAVSVAALCIDAGTLLGLKEQLGVHYVISSAAGMVLGTAIHYALAKALVFGDGRVKGRATEFLAYAALGGVGMAIGLAAIVVLTEGAGLDYRASKGLSIVLSFFAGYGLRKALLFGRGLKLAPPLGVTPA